MGNAALELLSKPSGVAAAACFFTVLILGRPLLTMAYEIRVEKKHCRDWREYVHPLRLLCCCVTLLSVLFVSRWTTAKYFARINEYAALSAGDFHFTSNYLKEKGNSYRINGWNGTSYTIHLKIKNYDNDLLVNQEGQNLDYGIYIKKLDENPNSYHLTVETAAETAVDEMGEFEARPEGWESSELYGPYRLVGTGQTELDQIQIQVASNGEALPAGTVIKFGVFVRNSRNNQFYKELQGDFSFEVAASQDFIREKVLGQNPENTLVTYQIKTNVLNEGTSEKKVIFKWDPAKLYLNEFESTAYKAIRNNPELFDKENGSLTLSLQAYSSVNLQFFKLDKEDEIIEDTDLGCTAEESKEEPETEETTEESNEA